MKKTLLTLTLACVTLAAVAATYKYRCPKCNRVSEYSQPQAGVKCPSGDGFNMIRK